MADLGSLQNQLGGPYTDAWIPGSSASYPVSGYGPGSKSEFSPEGSGGVVLGASASGPSAPAYDPITLQAISNIQSAINRTGSQLSAGNASLDNQASSALQQLLLGRNQGEASYNQGRQTNATNYVGAKNTIGSQAGSALSGLLRLLGSRGASGSAVDSARQAVARGATLQRADAGNAFGQNQQGLDTNWNNYLTGYNNQVTNVGAQRDQGKQALQNSINANKASLLQSLAQLQQSPSAAQPYLDQANSLYDQTANYVTPQINYQTQAYNAPSLASYNTEATNTSLKNQSGGDYYSPFLQTLLGKKQPGLA